MIYKNSNAPVLLKKINLKVWSLKEELTHIIMDQIDETEEGELIKKLVEEYAPDRPKLRLIKNEDDKTEAVNREEIEQINPEGDAPEIDTKDNIQEEIVQKIVRLPEEKVSQANTIMSEIYIDEIYFFSDSPFIEGQSIVINFCIPQNFIMNADVAFCQPYSSSNRVIGKGKLPFRICARFSFLRKGEKTLLRKFLETVEPEIPNLKEAEKPNTDDDEVLVSEDMFDEEENTDLIEGATSDPEKE